MSLGSGCPSASTSPLRRTGSRALEDAGCSYADGARVMGVSAVTALPVAMVRILPKPGLLEAAQTLGAEPAESGGNLLLVADVGEVGTRAALLNGPVAIAPEVRIWLDMLGEPRGEDAAALFREAVLGY